MHVEEPTRNQVAIVVARLNIPDHDDNFGQRTSIRLRMLGTKDWLVDDTTSADPRPRVSRRVGMVSLCRAGGTNRNGYRIGGVLEAPHATGKVLLREPCPVRHSRQKIAFASYFEVPPAKGIGEEF